MQTSAICFGFSPQLMPTLSANALGVSAETLCASFAISSAP